MGAKLQPNTAEIPLELDLVLPRFSEKAPKTGHRFFGLKNGIFQKHHLKKPPFSV